MNKCIELYKVKREIKMHGSEVVVKRKKLDEYNEPTKEKEDVTAFRGLFHISKGYMTKNISDGTSTRTKGQPMVLAELSDLTDVKNDDIIYYNNLVYKVVDINNIEQLNIVADISLELIIDGNI